MAKDSIGRIIEEVMKGTGVPALLDSSREILLEKLLGPALPSLPMYVRHGAAKELE